MKTRPVNGDHVDETAKRFLNVTSAKDVTVLEGQRIDPDKLNAAQEKELVEEACYFGDILVRYVTNHPDLTPIQRCWGFMLGLLCVRADYPEGVATFDDMADKGGEDLVLTKISKDNLEAVKMQPYFQNAVTPAEFEAAAKFSELFAKYVSKTKRSLGTSNGQAAYGLGRALHTLRLSFPETDGGPVGFDHWAASAGLYFRENKH